MPGSTSCLTDVATVAFKLYKLEPVAPLQVSAVVPAAPVAVAAVPWWYHQPDQLLTPLGLLASRQHDRMWL